MNKEYEIIDTRGIKSFKKETFSGYKKADVIKTLLKSIDSKKVENAINQVSKIIQNENFVILGPTFAPIEKINNYYRYHIIIKVNEAYKFQDFYFKNSQLSKFLSNLKGVKYKIDIDPLSLL